ncbi:hypothetical protein AABB24_026418 [Solanum stoloniferum]|uniref:HMA domain-containing protein n=1 Tax=Solanum stoloniferum TaxID=62892 RepID=A0ABD2SEU7_9SOLN
MHCEACAEQLKKKILRMKGVRSAETEASTGKVTVTGTMDANKLVDYVYRRTKKQAKIVPQPEPEPEKPAEETKPDEAKPVEEPKPEEKKDDGAAPAENKEGGDGEKPLEGEKNEGGGGGGEMIVPIGDHYDEHTINKLMYYHQYQPLYVIERIPPPQLFSDENPNACCIT